MLNILLHHVRLGDADTKVIQMAADTPPWLIFRHVRTKYPGYCFYESWVGNDERGIGRLAA